MPHGSTPCVSSASVRAAASRGEAEVELRVVPVLITAIGCALAAPANAQLRVVTYNVSAVRSGVATVLDQVGRERVNGIARAPDVLLLQEQESVAGVNAFRDALNALHGAGTYAAAPFTGISSGGGLPAMVYRVSSVELLGTVAIGSVSSAANVRQTLRYAVRPRGYGADATVYVYNSHFKASNFDPSDAQRRHAEALFNRANADALGPGRNVLFAGDLNLYSGAEAAYAALLAPGAAQAFDPIAVPSNWRDNSAARFAHTQSPATTPVYDGQVVGGVDDRFDFQLPTANLLDGEGVALIPGTYRVFGNNGTHPLNGAISSASNTWNPPGLTLSRSAVLGALTTASDHLPLVADYQIPAKMSAAVVAAPPRVLVGAWVQVHVDVANVAPVSAAIGADELDFTVSGAGAIVGSTGGTVAALAAPLRRSLGFDTSTPGLRAGTISVNATSQAAADATHVEAVGIEVLDHARPSLAMEAVLASRHVDLGVVALAAGHSAELSVFNLAGVAPTAALRIDGVSGAGDADEFALPSLAGTQIAAGGGVPVLVSAPGNRLGAFAASWSIETRDEDLPGATALAPLGLSASVVVALGGDANLDSRVDVSDLGALAGGWQASGGWGNGDFSRNGVVDVADLGILSGNWLSGVPGPLAPGGVTWPLSIPEPASGTLALFALAASLRNRNGVFA